MLLQYIFTWKKGCLVDACDWLHTFQRQQSIEFYSGYYGGNQELKKY